MYSKFSKKEWIASTVAWLVTLSLAGIFLYFVQASPASDFIGELESAVTAPVVNGVPIPGGGASPVSSGGGGSFTSTSGGSSGVSVTTSSTSGGIGVLTSNPTLPSQNTQIPPLGNTPTLPIKPSPTSPVGVSPVSTPISTSSQTPQNIAETPDTSGNTTSSNENTALAFGGLESAPTICNLPKITDLAKLEEPTKTTLSWRSLSGASAYSISKKTDSGEYVFIAQVTSPSYTIYLAPGKVKYDEFKITWVCSTTQTASTNTATITKVKTWPFQTTLFILLSGMIGLGIFYRKKWRDFVRFI